MPLANWAACRIAPLRDEDVFRLDPSSPGVLGDGTPWVRWCNLGEWSGWYAIGTRQPPTDFGTEPAFWSVVLALGTEVGNGRLDAVHCIGPGILSLGGIGTTLASGYGADVLGYCLVEQPALYLDTMAPVIIQSGAYPSPLPDGHWCLHHYERGALCLDHELRGAVMRSGSGQRWTGGQKELARTWVTAVARLLSHWQMDAAQVRACSVLPDLLPPAVLAAIGWPSNGDRDLWMYTREQQALWAATMVVFLEDFESASRLAGEAFQREPVDARASLRALRERAAGYTKRFRRRVERAVDEVCRIYATEQL